MNLDQIAEKVAAFRDARDWKKFHSPKEMLLSLTIEVAELAEIFRFKSDLEISNIVNEKRAEISDELADILYWVVIISKDMGISLEEAFLAKMQKNEIRYPVELSKGNAKKYSELDR